MLTENSQNSQEVFSCDNCDYTCFRKSDYKKHLSTDKHQKNVNDSKMVVTDSNKTKKTN